MRAQSGEQQQQWTALMDQQQHGRLQRADATEKASKSEAIKAAQQAKTEPVAQNAEAARLAAKQKQKCGEQRRKRAVELR